MAEPTTFPEEHVRELVVYRRISGFAITSLAFAVSFAVCLVMATLWGLRDRSPLLLPAWVQALPVIGAALALTAMYLIRNSEGTLAGMKLAVWGWWLSVVFGLGYWAYFAATYFAVQKQAEDFALGWLNKVKDGKFGDAFMDTQDPANRQKFKSEALDQINIQFLMAMGMPKDGVLRPPLDVFRENPLVHLIEQGGAGTQIVSLAVKSWDFKGGGYQVKRNFQITTEEGISEVVVTVIGQESKSHEYEGRQWQIQFSETKVEHTQPSQLGIRIAELDRESGRFLEEWGNRLSMGNLMGAYADTLEPAEQNRMVLRNFAELAGTALAAGTLACQGVPAGPLASCAPWCLSVPLAISRHRPEIFTVLKKNDFVKGERLVADDESTKEAALEGLETILGKPVTKPRMMRFMFSAKPNSVRRCWKVNNDRIQLPHDCNMGIPNPPIGGYSLETTITVESDPGALDAARHPSWRVVGVELISVSDKGKQQNNPMGINMPSPEKMRGGGKPPRVPPRKAQAAPQ